MEFDEAQSRRQFLLQSGIVLGGLSGIDLSRVRQLPPGCPTPPFGPIDCAPPAGIQSAVPWTPDPTLAMRTRYSAFDPAGAANLQKLQKAYAALRQLSKTNPNDPRGWMQQAHVHCWYCGGGQNGVQGPEIHSSWWFFAWHRCYLYFHERTLASVIKDPTVALTYWNWDDVSSTKNLGVPPAFYTGSLNDLNREATLGETMDPGYVTGLTPSDPSLLELTTLNWFGSDPGNQEPSNGGQLENGPHGVVHLWTGAANEPGTNLCTTGVFQGKPDMGVLATAAQDPVFFAHHSNIDRLWDVWLAYQAANNTGQKNPAWPGNKSWAFWNANLDGTGKWVTMSIASVLNHEQTLRYRYAPPPSATLAAAARPGQQVGLGTAPVTQVIPVPDNVRSRVAAVEQATKQNGGHVLHIEMQLSSNTGAFVDVYGNMPNATAATSKQTPNYLGYFAIVPKGGKDHPMSKHIVIDVTRKLPNLLHGSQSLAATLVPKVGPRAGARAEPPRITVTRIYLTPRT
jgi:polyphenol oxidase